VIPYIAHNLFCTFTACTGGLLVAMALVTSLRSRQKSGMHSDLPDPFLEGFSDIEACSRVSARPAALVSRGASRQEKLHRSPSRSPSKDKLLRVRFALHLNTEHEVTPYSEVYNAELQDVSVAQTHSSGFWQVESEACKLGAKDTCMDDDQETLSPPTSESGSSSSACSSISEDEEQVL